MSDKIFSKRAGFSNMRCVVASSLLAILVAGCGFSGFEPMYASSHIGGSVLSAKMRSLKVTTVPGRVGQLIRNEIIFQSTGGGHAEEAKYRLDITIKESVTSTLVSVEGDSAGQIYQLNATFQLVDISNNKTIISGDSYGRAGFERFSSIFSNVRAKKDAEDRAAKTVAHDIKSRLEAALSNV